MSRVELAKISTLTFYKGEYTAARRTPAIPQLVCQGKPCKLFQPEAVRCVNTGGVGIDVDWKVRLPRFSRLTTAQALMGHWQCEADLPEALRFGKVEVSCEGWSKPGDPYVLKGASIVSPNHGDLLWLTSNHRRFMFAGLPACSNPRFPP